MSDINILSRNVNISLSSGNFFDLLFVNCFRDFLILNAFDNLFFAFNSLSLEL